MNDSWIRGYSETVLKEVVRKNLSNRYTFRKYTFPFTLCGWISGPGIEIVGLIGTMGCVITALDNCNAKI